MPLTQSKDYRPNSQPELTEEERKAQEKARRKFALALEDMADEGDAVLITVLKDIGIKDFGNGSAQGYLIRFIALTGDHEGLVNDEWPVYKRGFLNRIEKAGVGASFVSRLGRYGERKTIGLEDNLDEDVAIAKVALKKHGDPFEDQTPSESRSTLTEGNGEVKARAKAKAAVEADSENPPF
jgi:uncharacterized Zn ribbon protein